MKVINWIGYNSTDDMTVSVDLFGGFFANGMRWKDYLAQCPTEIHHYLEAIRAEVVAKEIRITGAGHQYDDAGCPVFEDGATATLSYRAWGDLMAAIWSEAEDTDYNYMDFYM